MPFKWHFDADDGPTLNTGLKVLWFQGIRTSIAKKPYIFVIFRVSLDPLPPSGSAHGSVPMPSFIRAIAGYLYDN